MAPIGYYPLKLLFYDSVQFNHSVVFDCDPMNSSMPGFPVHHLLLEFTQIHVHWVGDAIQPSHPPLPSSPPALNFSQYQGKPPMVYILKIVSLNHQQCFLSIFQIFSDNWVSFQIILLNPIRHSCHNKKKEYVGIGMWLFAFFTQVSSFKWGSPCVCFSLLKFWKIPSGIYDFKVYWTKLQKRAFVFCAI